MKAPTGSFWLDPKPQDCSAHPDARITWDTGRRAWVCPACLADNAPSKKQASQTTEQEGRDAA